MHERPVGGLFRPGDENGRVVVEVEVVRVRLGGADAALRAHAVGRARRQIKDEISRLQRQQIEVRLPNPILLPSTAVLAVGELAADRTQSRSRLIAAAAAYTGFLILALVYPPGLGMGDVKLVFFLGIGLGAAVVYAIALGARVQPRQVRDTGEPHSRQVQSAVRIHGRDTRATAASGTTHDRTLFA
jgi:hypothetical protein